MKIIKKSVLISLILMLILLITCCKQTSDPIDDKKDIENELIVFLHAGGSYDGLTHLNAQETFEYYYNQGYRYFEYDLKLSSDGKIISTHDWEHLDVYNPTITYEEFKTLKLSNGFTPANEEWIIETIKKYPDVIFIIDAKMNTTEGDAAVLTRLEELESIYNIDISKNIIPEVFSIEMWEIVKKATSFDKYLYSQYKEYYTVDTMLENFTDDRFWGFSFPTYVDGDIRSRFKEIKETKKIFIFTPLSVDEVNYAKDIGVDGVYIDFISLIE